jgi:hypothetical protein
MPQAKPLYSAHLACVVEATQEVTKLDQTQRSVECAQRWVTAMQWTPLGSAVALGSAQEIQLESVQGLQERQSVGCVEGWHLVQTWRPLR